MREGLKGLLEEKLITVLFPRRCPVCEEIVVPKGRKICPACRGKLSYVSGPFCLKCGKELTDPEGATIPYPFNLLILPGALRAL